MARFNPSGKNAETLVIEWLNRTNRKTVTRNDFSKCWFYWLKRGAAKEPETYERAFRRMREAGKIDATFADKKGKIRVNTRPQKAVVTSRHDQDIRGRRYNPYGWRW